MNKTLTTIIAACMMMPPAVTAQTTATVDGVKYFLLDGEATVMAQTGQLEGDIVIPETVRYGGETYSVVKLVDEAFAGQEGITSVTLPNSVTEMGNSCFSGCGNMTSIKLPDGITSLGDNFFHECTSLKELTLPETITSLGEYCMAKCASLDTLEIPDGVTSIGGYGFYACYGLKSIKLPSKLTEIQYCCFEGCDDLESITIPYGVKVLETQCFSGCKKLTKVSFPNSLTTLGNSCFEKCESLKSITLPNSVTTVDLQCFYLCTSLESVILSNSLATLGGSCFSYCEKLKSITLPDGIKTLSEGCFNKCTSLETIVFPESIERLGGFCFKDCFNLTNIYCNWNSPDDVETDEDCFDGIFSEAALHVPEGTADAYKAEEPWNRFKYIIEDGKPVTIEKCATPEIDYRDGRLTFTSLTEGVRYHYTITANDATAEAYTETGAVTLAAAYGISVYASAEGYANSDAATATLYFTGGSLDPTAIAATEARRALLVTTDGRTLTVSGLADGETATLYSLQGCMLDTAKAYGGQARLDTRGEKGAVVLKAGGQSVKVSVR